jgi:hypothetical protein
MKTKASLIATTCLILAGGTARADLAAGDGASRTAETLKEGQTSVGAVIHPTGIGLTDRVQASTVLLMSVFGIPNIDVAVRILDGESFDLTLVGNAMYGLGWNTAQYGGQVVAAQQVTPNLTVGLRAGAGRQEIMGDNEVDLFFVTMATVEATLVKGGGYVDWTIDRSNVVYAEAEVMLPLLDEPPENEAGTVNGLHVKDLRWEARMGFTHAWQRFRLSAMLIHTRGMLADSGIPVRPMADFWWTF